jgi:hypothetical protein
MKLETKYINRFYRSVHGKMIVLTINISKTNKEFARKFVTLKKIQNNIKSASRPPPPHF